MALFYCRQLPKVKVDPEFVAWNNYAMELLSSQPAILGRLHLACQLVSSLKEVRTLDDSYMLEFRVQTAFLQLQSDKFVSAVPAVRNLVAFKLDRAIDIIERHRCALH
jgi:hypothetical protein